MLCAKKQDARPSSPTPPTQAPTLASPASLANKTASVLAAVNAKEKAWIASLGVKPNIATVAATLSVHKTLASGGVLTVVEPSSSAVSAPSGTLQFLVTADGVVAGLVGSNGEAKKRGEGRGESRSFFSYHTPTPTLTPTKNHPTQATTCVPPLQPRMCPSPLATVI